jgi:predicted ribosomally synthesized peptide with nif11-like leader
MSVENARNLILKTAKDTAFRTQVESAPESERRAILVAAGFGDVTHADVEEARASVTVELTDAEMEAVAGGSVCGWIGTTAGAVAAVAAWACVP